MIKKDLRPYELSLWTLQDGFITTLKSMGFSDRGQIETPICRIKKDGTQELTFSIPMYCREKGKFIENPIWYNVVNGALIVNLRKLKLIFNKGEKGEEVFEFVISKVVETHTNGQLQCEVTAEGLTFQELGKVGYKISLSSQDFIEEYNDWYNATVGENTEEEQFDFFSEEDKAAAEPINNLNYWCNKIFKNSKWTYSIEMDWSSYDGITTEIDNETREAMGLRRTDKIYEEEYISSWEYQEKSFEEGALVPSRLENFKEKLRLVDLEKSNIYNLTQNLAETFGVYCKYKYIYDNNYHIIGKKCIYYNNFLSEKDGKVDIIYPYDTSKIEREIDSADIVTKMFVTSIEDSTSPSGLITIADVAANKMREDYILNFDYLYSIGTITQEQYDAIADYERSIYLINNELEPIAMQIANLQSDLMTYQAQLTLAKESQILDKEQMEQSTALLDSITKDKRVLYKNLDTPYRGTLSNSANNDGTYSIKISQEGVDLTGQVGYPLHEGETNIYGIRLFYYAEIVGETENSTTKILVPYAQNEPDTFSGPIFPEEIEIEKDEFGNIIALSNIQLRDNALSKSYFITFAYKPELHYQNIYDTYAKKLAEDEALEKEAVLQIKEIENKIERLENKYKLLLENKTILIADFENMMGPALKEGSWQAENYNDYGSKYTQEVTVGILNNSHINFIWDEKAFDEEQLLYYKEGVDSVQKYYYCIDLSFILDKIQNNLEDLSFIYNLNKTEESSDILNFEQMTIGSELQFAFIKKDNEIKPVLLLTDISFDLNKPGVKESCFLGLISSTLTSDGVKVKTEVLVENKEITWIVNDENSIIVYPRLKVDTLFLKTSEDELIIHYENKLLKNYYDYSILIRDENYLITLKNKIMLLNANLYKTFNIAYAISNASLSLYLDALEVSKTNAFPQVSYTLEISALNKKFIQYAYKNLNQIVTINDAELKFENVQGYISELELNLENPWEDKVTIQNYKTKFEDLFSTIVASTEQMKTNSFAYNNAASAFNSGGVLKPSVIQNTINQADLTYAFQSGNLTIDEINGIWARSDAGVVAMRGGGIFCATQTDSNGNWLWNTGIMPSGINASLITAGQIDTNLIKIYAGDNLRLQLNSEGLFAYNVNDLGEANLNQYVVHNSEGLFSSIIENNKKIDLVEISWNGLILRDKNNQVIFNADREGNLSIIGTITAKDGNIGNWLVKEDGLWAKDNNAGIITRVKVDDEGEIIAGTELYPMFWVTGQGKEGKKFEVYSDGTVYANNIFLNGFISSNSVIGNTSGEEISNQLRNIEISVLEGSTFIFNNRNYDNNLIVEPSWLYFRIKTHALTPEELTNSEYKFYYGVSKDGGVTKKWEPMPKDNNDLYDEKYLIWDSEYLTFTIKSDIMYLGLEESLEPNTILYFKVEKLGKLKQVNSETGETSYNEDYSYFDEIQLNSEKHGLGKYITPIDPPSYTFIEDKNENIQYEETKTFSVILTGFSLQEASSSYWLINGGEERYDYQIIGSVTKTSSSESEIGAIISDEENIIIADQLVENEDKLNGNTENDNNGITINLIEQEDGSILATATVSYQKVPEGGSLALTFCFDTATRTTYCFRNRNGADGINIILRSSSGSTLTSGDTNTELSIEVYYGMQLVNGENSKNQLYYVWKKDNIALSNISYKEINIDDSGEEILAREEIKNISANNNGFFNEDFFIRRNIYITTQDFGIKANYTCTVFTTLEEAIEEYLLLNEEGFEG